MFTVYALFAQDLPGHYRYVGVTKDIKSRLCDHKVKKKGSRRKCKWVMDVKERGSTICIQKLAQFPDLRTAMIAEWAWRLFLSRNHDLLNGAWKCAVSD